MFLLFLLSPELLLSPGFFYAFLGIPWKKVFSKYAKFEKMAAFLNLGIDKKMPIL